MMKLILVDIYNRFDQISWLFHHRPEGFLDFIENVEFIIQKLPGMHAVIPYHLEYLADSV